MAELSGIQEIDDLDDLTEVRPADAEPIANHEDFAGDDADDSFLDDEDED